MQHLKIFFTSFLQVGFVCINTVLIAKGYVLGIFIASMTISLIWSYNVAKIALSNFKEKIIYSFGAGVGSIAGYYFINFFL